MIFLFFFLFSGRTHKTDYWWRVLLSRGARFVCLSADTSSMIYGRPVITRGDVLSAMDSFNHLAIPDRIIEYECVEPATGVVASLLFFAAFLRYRSRQREYFQVYKSGWTSVRTVKFGIFNKRRILYSKFIHRFGFSNTLSGGIKSFITCFINSLSIQKSNMIKVEFNNWQAKFPRENSNSN